MDTTPNDVAAFLGENAEWWEQAACLFEHMAVTPPEASGGNESLWRLQGAIYRERSNLCKSLLLGAHNAEQRESNPAP